MASMNFADAENARMVPTRDGWKPEPPLDPTWPDLIKLRWHAALIRDKTGLNIAVNKGKYSINGIPQAGYYAVHLRYGNTAQLSGPHTFADAWNYLNGIETGATAVLNG